MPRVLLLTYHFPPSAASGTFRLLGFARHLPRHGWDCIVVAPPTLPWEPADPRLVEQIPVQTIRYSVPYPAGLPKAARWLAPYAVWLPYARTAAIRAAVDHRPEVVLTSGPPHWTHLLGRTIQKRFAIPWIADFRDPWITAAFGSPEQGWRWRWQLFWERRILRQADRILANAPRFCQDLQQAYPLQADRIRTLTNGYDPESFPPRQADSPPAQRRIRLLHAGQLYAGRDPRPILDAIAGIDPEAVPRFQLEFLGRTEYEKGADVTGDASSRGIGNLVICRGQLGYQESLAEMCQADILVLMDTPGRKIGVPAKLYEYLGAGRPILATGESDGDLAGILQASGVPHRIVPPDDPPRIRAAIVELVQGVANGQLAGPDEQRERFTRQSLAGELAALLREVSRPGAS